MRRITPRDLMLYLLVVLMMFFTVSTLQRMDQEDAPDYSQIRIYFSQSRVKYFTLEDNTLTLTLREQGDQTSTLTYQLADPYLFYFDLRDEIDKQLASGTLEGSFPVWRAPGGTTCCPSSCSCWRWAFSCSSSTASAWPA